MLGATWQRKATVFCGSPQLQNDAFSQHSRLKGPATRYGSGKVMPTWLYKREVKEAKLTLNLFFGWHILGGV